jgi:hypothetical protein
VEDKVRCHKEGVEKPFDRPRWELGNVPGVHPRFRPVPVSSRPGFVPRLRPRELPISAEGL